MTSQGHAAIMFLALGCRVLLLAAGIGQQREVRLGREIQVLHAIRQLTIGQDRGARSILVDSVSLSRRSRDCADRSESGLSL